MASDKLNAIADQIQGQFVPNVEESALYTPFRRMPEAVPEAECEQLRSAARAYIADAIFPAMARLRDFLTETYLPAGDRPIAASSLPDGEAYYAHCMYEHTTVQATPAEIHQTGLKEVVRIRAAMDSVLQETGFKGSLQEFGSFLRSDPRFYYTKAEDLVTGVRRHTNSCYLTYVAIDDAGHPTAVPGVVPQFHVGSWAKVPVL